MAATTPVDDSTTWPIGVFTCRTTDCPFEGVANAIPCIDGVEDTRVVCGGCNQPITDRTPAAKGIEPGIVAPEPEPESDPAE